MKTLFLSFSPVLVCVPPFTIPFFTLLQGETKRLSCTSTLCKGKKSNMCNKLTWPSLRMRRCTQVRTLRNLGIFFLLFLLISRIGQPIWNYFIKQKSTCINVKQGIKRTPSALPQFVLARLRNEGIVSLAICASFSLFLKHSCSKCVLSRKLLSWMGIIKNDTDRRNIKFLFFIDKKIYMNSMF